MNDFDLTVLQNFAALWARVTGEDCAPPPGTDWRLEAIEHLYGLVWGYGDMARCARGGVRRRLCCMQAEAQTMLKHLQAGMYLDTGDTFIPVKCRIFCKLTASDLQKLWRNATQLARLRDCGSLRETDPAASDLQAAAELGQRHSVCLREILAELL